MPQGNPVRLLSLADREFRQLTGKPVVVASGAKFKAMKLNPARLDKDWDRKRGAAVRLTRTILKTESSVAARSSGRSWRSCRMN
jgi:hypothetical protein